MKKEYDKKERYLTNLIKLILIFTILLSGTGISTLIGGWLGSDKWVLGLLGAFGAFCALIMKDIASARIDLRKTRSGISVNNKKNKISLNVFKIAIFVLASFLLKKIEKEDLKPRRKSKAETVTELYLIHKSSKLIMAKNIAICGIILNAAMYFFIDLPFATTGLFFAIVALLQIKEELLIYRINKGYFGSTTREAMMLIRFIDNHNDDSDMNSGGRRMPVFKDITQEINEKQGIYEGSR